MLKAKSRFYLHLVSPPLILLFKRGCAMIKSFAPLLRRIVGRIKMYRHVVELAFSLMLVPLGFYLFIEGRNPQEQMVGGLSIMSGIILFIIVWIEGMRAEKRKNEDEAGRFRELITEIRGLRQDLRNGGDDSGRDNNTTK